MFEIQINSNHKFIFVGYHTQKSNPKDANKEKFFRIQRQQPNTDQNGYAKPMQIPNQIESSKF